jgi:putative membrane protein
MKPWTAIAAIWNDTSLITKGLLGAWLLATISMPILQWWRGKRTIRWSVTAMVVLQASAVISSLVSTWGWQRAALVAVSIAAMGWLAEYIGSSTGVPFGRYHYTDRLWPQLGHVPLIIPLAWVMMLPPSWSIAGLVARHHRWIYAGVSALAFTAWDLFLDPQMVGWRLWVWDRKGRYFGIPLVNYVGWALVSGLMTIIIAPGDLAGGPLYLIYALTWGLETFGLGVLWRQPGPAACGFVGMGSILLWTWLVGI